MKTLKLTGLCIVLGCLLGLFAGSPAPLSAGNGASPAVEKVLPDTTFAYIAVNDLDTFREQFKKTNLYELWNDPEIQESLAWIGEMIREEIGKDEKLDPFAVLQEVCDKLLSTVHGQAGFGLFYDPEAEPDAKNMFKGLQAAGIVNVGKDSATWFNTLRELDAKFKEADGKPNFWNQCENNEKTGDTQYATYTCNDVTVYTQTDLGDGSQHAVFHHKDSVVYCYGVGCDAPAKRLIDNLDNPPAAALASRPFYAKARESVKTDSAAVTLAFDIKAFLKKYSPHFNEDTRKALDAFGISAMESFCGTVSMEGKLFRSRTAIDWGIDKRGLAALFTPAPREFKSVSFVPATSAWYFSWLVDGGALFDELKRLVRDMDEDDAEDMMAGLAEAREATGVDIENDLIRNINGELGIFVKQWKTEGMPLPQFYLFAQVKDEESFDSALQSLVAFAAEESGGEVTWNTDTYKDVDYSYVQIPLPVPMDISPSWLFHDGFFFLCMNTADMKELIDLFASDYESLLENEKTKAMFAKYPVNNCISLSYNDVPVNLESYMNLFKHFCEAFLGGMAAAPFDLSKLPDIKTVCKHLEPTAGYATVTGNTFYGEDTANLGFTGATWVAIVGAIAVPNLLESKRLSNERTVPAVLKMIHAQQTICKEKCHADADEDAVGEYMPLIDPSGTVDPDDINDLIDAGLNMIANGENGIAEKNGYYYACFIPEDVDEAEEAFCVVAWPKKWGKTGDPAFFINESGITQKYNNQDGRFDGLDKPVTLADVYETAFDNMSIDTETWTVVK